jgi:6-phosphogluconolactonase
VILQRFDSPAEAAAALASQIIPALRMALNWRGVASLGGAGGRTPAPLLRMLRDADLDWAKVAVTLTDERWVPEDHAASNAALLRTELLAGRAGVARFVPLYDASAASAAAAAGAVWNTVAAMPRPFDAVVLGMGEDGHFASLFPGNPGLAAALDPQADPGCVAMRAPVEPMERISLNLAALLQTRRLFLLVTGEVKRELLLTAARREPHANWPVATLLAQRHPSPEVFWAP